MIDSGQGVSQFNRGFGMEFHSVRALVDVLQTVLVQEEDRLKREGRGSSAGAVDFDVRMAFRPATDWSREDYIPVVLKGAGGKVWLTAYNADGELPSEVEQDLGVSSEMLIDMDEAGEAGRYGRLDE
ncbi:hypothetical protein Sipo8835_22910 [Streptomyces ipomoeae]|uniref:Uncharacterized protein n=1 Tax=Streptomyces ipomoeae TaxID=103232 RepID=A0AAE9AZX4_9ACTN|nr:hypothetical protein [Streptomyces ipomoeae]TQE30930.1 hypothetical protein Sipo8835_22910 [Streptomyces ipomoeae]